MGLLSNDEVIEIDQDPLGRSGRRVAKSGDAEVWAKGMADGTVAVGLFNRGEAPTNFRLGWAAMALFWFASFPRSGVELIQADRSELQHRDGKGYNDKTFRVDPMPYSLLLKNMIDALVVAWPGMEVKPMFGGIAYLIDDKLAFGVYQNFLIARLGEDTAAKRLSEEGVQILNITGKLMKGWLMIAESRWRTEEELLVWLNLARDFVGGIAGK